MIDTIERRYLTVNAEVAGKLLGISRGSAYEGVRNGDINSIEVGCLRRVPVAFLEQRLGLFRGELDGVIDRLIK